MVPKAGEPGSETWLGKGIEHPSAVTWFAGTYDAESDTLYWPTGNPGADYFGDDRKGDNLYSDCILALDAKTGTVKWYYQFTPHDLWDWDATETPVLVDAAWQGQQRKLLLHANRNGFFYVLDRTSGKLLLAKQFIKTLTWASGIGPDGRPVKNPDQEPAEKGTKVCPSQVSGVGGGTGASGRLATQCSRSKAAKDLARHRHPYRQDRLGTNSKWIRGVLGREVIDRYRIGLFRRG